MFEYTSRIRYDEVGCEGVASPSALANYLQNAAIFHAGEVGYDIYRMLEMRRGWFLLSWHIRFGRSVRWNEEIRIRTWAYDFREPFGRRNFQIFDRQGGDSRGGHIAVGVDGSRSLDDGGAARRHDPCVCAGGKSAIFHAAPGKIDGGQLAPSFASRGGIWIPTDMSTISGGWKWPCHTGRPGGRYRSY
ncbi:MAG: acyl-ACP thioesterase domain-containing protein [Clostridia bacterium]